jgi:hypothetical protein
MVGQGEWNEASWRKSKRSGSEGGGGCVAVAAVGSYGAVRDSKNSELTTIVMPMAALRRLLKEIKRGELDLH